MFLKFTNAQDWEKKRDRTTEEEFWKLTSGCKKWLLAVLEAGREWISIRNPVDSGQRVLKVCRKLELPVTQKARLCVNWKSKALMSLKPGQYVHPSRSSKGNGSLPAGNHVFTLLTKQKRQRGRTTWLRLSTDRKLIILSPHTALFSWAPSKAPSISKLEQAIGRILAGETDQPKRIPNNFPSRFWQHEDPVRMGSSCSEAQSLQGLCIHGGTEGLKVTAVLRRKINQILIKEARTSKNKAKEWKKIES